MRPWSAGVLGLALLLTACADKPSPQGSWRKVVLITVDTLRADHLGCYGYDRPTSPRLDALAAKSARFERALVPTPRTTQSLASILTGRTPAAHGVRTLYQRLPQKEVTLAERFAEAGYRTGAFVVVPFFPDRMGFGQGFGEDFEKFTTGAEVRADQVTDRALEWIAQRRDDPFFLWIHYRDPHAPYFPPQRFHERLDPDYTGSMDVFHYWPVDEHGEPLPGMTDEERKRMKGRFKFGAEKYPPEDVRRAIALYDGEIAFVDEQIGRILDALQAQDLDDETVLAITADHGESLGEHDFWFDHGEFLYDDCLRVPMLVHAPGLPAVTVPSQVGTIDVAPTLVELFGLPTLPSPQGVSFAAALRGEPTADRDLFAESGEPFMWWENPRFAGRDQPPADPQTRLRAFCPDRRQKAILDPVAREEQGDIAYYRLDQDPGELRDLAPDPAHAKIVEKARNALRSLVQFDQGSLDWTAIPADLRQLLGQQGYIGGGPPPDPPKNR